MFEAKALRTLAQKAGKTFGYGAVVLTHGEHDSDNAYYETAVYNLWNQYNNDLKAITGQSQDIPMILSQQNSVPTYTKSENGTIIPPGFAYSTQAQWLLGVHNPGKIIVSGPKYQYAYVDGIHMNATGYELAGEKYAEAFYKTVEKNTPWVPLQPSALQWVPGTNTVTISFDVPSPPLQWNTSLTNHQAANIYWKSGRGFEVLAANNSPLTITSAELTNNDTAVKLTLESAPTSGPLTIQYAMTQDGTQVHTGYTGSTLGRRGQLRDSDPFVGYMTGQNQPNYCLAFALRTDNTLTPPPETLGLVSNGLVHDFGPFNLKAGDSITQKVEPGPGVTRMITSEIWNADFTTQLCQKANLEINICTYTATAPITVYVRSYDGTRGDPYTVTLTR
jgi:hypothetical protein